MEKTLHDVIIGSIGWMEDNNIKPLSNITKRELIVLKTSIEVNLQHTREMSDDVFELLSYVQTACEFFINLGDTHEGFKSFMGSELDKLKPPKGLDDRS